MVFLEITGFGPPPEPLEKPARREVAEVLEAEHLGGLSDLEQGLRRLPFRVGPLRDFRQADSLTRLLAGFGAEATVVEDGRPPSA